MSLSFLSSKFQLYCYHYPEATKFVQHAAAVHVKLLSLEMEGNVRCTAVGIGNPAQTSAQQEIRSTAQNMPPLTHATQMTHWCDSSRVDDFPYPTRAMHFPNYLAVGK
jgi:hypothetical protein